MTLVKNALLHPYSPTVGHTLAPQEIADITLTYPQEIDAINVGALIVIDPDYVPPTPAPDLNGAWKSPVELTADLPPGGNGRGDVRLVMLDAGTGGTVARYWDGNSWEVLAGGGVVTPPADLTFAGVDGTGPWIDAAVSSTVAGVDGTGPWIDGAISSTRAGVDGTGPWIDPT